MLMTIKRAALPTLVLAALAVAAVGPAFAKASLTHSQQICESAVKAQSPAPKSAKVDSDLTRADDDTAIFTLDIRKADDSAGKVTCSVDRKTSKPTIAPAN
jgi:siroheme synthase